MAGKLLRIIGVKKNPPQPPKPDYTPKSASTDSSLARSPPSETSFTSLSTATSHIGDVEVAQLQCSPHRIVSGGAEKGAAFGGARPKDSGGGVSPKSTDRAQMRSTSSVDEPEAPAKGQSERLDGATGGPSATPVS